MNPNGPPQTPAQIREHYEIEKELARRLRHSTFEERRTLYTATYDELFRRVPHHPQLTIKASPEASAIKVAYEIRHLQPFLKESTVFLEIGPGDCALSFAVCRQVKTVYAIDVSEEITRSLSRPPNFQLILSDGASIPVPPGGIDVAYSDQLMEHLHPDDALVQLHHIYQALAPGGVYLCLTPNRLNGPHDVSKHFDDTATGLHLKEYTVAELTRMFRATGFRKISLFVSVRNVRLQLPALPARILEAMLGHLPPGVRKPLASFWPVAKLLGINLIARK